MGNLLQNIKYFRFRRFEKKTIPKIILVFLLAGVITRISAYLQTRSLFLDEANLARNFGEKAFVDFFLPLDYEQFAPPLFSVFQKFSILAFGINEYALRLIPLLSGIASLYLFYAISRNIIRSKFILWFPIFIFCFSLPFIRYATEVKQYGTDIFITLFLIFLVYRIKSKDFSWRTTAFWIVIGTFAIWFSMPAVFILTGVGSYYFFRFLKAKNKKALLQIAITIFIWLISFGFYYYSILRKDIAVDPLQAYHEPYFLPFFSFSKEELIKTLEIARSVFHTATGYTYAAYICSVLGFLTGFVVMTKWKRFLAILLLFPLFFCLLASSLELYSLISRLTLFLIPIVLIIIGIGWDYLWFRFSRIGKIAIVGLLLFTASIHDGYRHIFQPLEIEEIKPILSYVQQNMDEGDQIFINHLAVPAYHFYAHLHDQKNEFILPAAIEGSWRDSPEPMLQKSGQKLWYIYSHALSEETRGTVMNTVSALREKGLQIDQHHAKGAGCYLFKPK
ncbi:MAG: hypothetical protein GY705_03295 [Bacteroidetes bacterium]|nr:hypothetical protein [Bacteroidota bacterium]